MTHPDTLQIPRAVAEQALEALKSLDLNRWTIDLSLVGPAIDSLRAALQAQPTPPVDPDLRTVRITKAGVNFGNAWISHERITGENAGSLNSGGSKIVAREYMKWLNAQQPTPPVGQTAAEPVKFTEETRVGPEFLDGPIEQARTKDSILGVRVQDDMVIIRMRGGKRWGNQWARELCHKILTDREQPHEPGGNPNAFNKWS